MAAWWWLGRGVEVKLVQPQRGTAAEVVYATGTVEPVLWAKVAALQRKRIVDLCRCEGKAVSKGEVLARLDDIEERAVLAELEARLARLREDAVRLQTLVARNVTARTTYDDKLTQVREYEARVAAQKDRISELELRAPMDGVVLRRDGEIGEIAGTGANDVLLWVGQPKPLRVVAEVNEDDIGKVREGQKVLLRHEGHAGQPLTASVGSLTPKGDPATKTFRVYLALPDDTPLKIGMSVEANIVVREVADALLVPAEAIGDGQVQVVAGSRVERRAVETGIRGTRMVEIRKGLAAGEGIASPFNAGLKDGARVRPQQAAAP
jgi:RND family efflux transporter MFP subunit